MTTLGSGPYGSFTFGGSGASSSTTATLPSSSPYLVPGTSSWTVHLYVEADLSQAVDGFEAGGSTYASLWGDALWGTDVWADPVEWTDITSWVRSISMKSGFSIQSEEYQTGTCQVVLDNRAGYFSPDNTQSPLRAGGSTTIGVGRPFRVRAEMANSWLILDVPLFTGTIRSWDESFPMKGRDAVVTIGAVDTWAQLAAVNAYATGAVGAGELSGARINRILDAANYTGDRFIDPGANTLLATDLSGNIVSQLKAVAESEGGAVWCGPDGAIYFDDQNALTDKARSYYVWSSFDDASILDVQMSYDTDLIINKASYERTGGTAQLATAQNSVNLYHDHLETKTGLLVDSDPQALALAQRRVAIYQTPERRVESIRINAVKLGDEFWNGMVFGGYQLRSLAYVTVTPPAGDAIARYVFIRSIAHKIDRSAAGWVTDLEFQSATVWRALRNSVWGTATWGDNAWSL